MLNDVVGLNNIKKPFNKKNNSLKNKENIYPDSDNIYEDEKIKACYIGEIGTYCEQVRCGTKLVAEVGFDQKYFEFIKHLIEKEKLHAIYNFDRPYDRASVQIYKYDFVRVLLNELNQKSNNEVSALSIWVTGKLFGYSDFEISNYLKEHGYIKKSIK